MDDATFQAKVVGWDFYICYRKDCHLMSSATTIAAKVKQLKHRRLCDVPFSPCHISIVATLKIAHLPQ
jgi:hypothetical protein